MLLQDPSPSASPKTLTNPFISPSVFPKNLIPQFRRTSFLLRASAAGDAKAQPKSAIQRIADKLRSLGYLPEEGNINNQNTNNETVTLSNSPGEIFIPLPNRIPKHRVGHTLGPSWSTPPGSGKEKVKRRDEGSNVDKERESVPTMAELKVSRNELRRLIGVGIRIKKDLKIGKAGITEGIVNGIHQRWRNTKLVKIRCEDLCKFNMKRSHDLLERKTGGLVVWRSGSIIILYRGADYKYPYFFAKNVKPNDTSVGESMDSEEGGAQESYTVSTDDIASGEHMKTTQPPLIRGVGSGTRVRFQLPGEAQLAEEADQLLHGLGPRFIDCYGYDPLPVDADLLPEIIPGYRKPFRLLPFGVRQMLTGNEMTTLRRLGRPLPCHFALGRNRKHQGLAAAILKLWEKCEIAKIAVKKGVQNTNSVLMAEELKWLTGGSIISRDEYIVLYRGKDFLPAMFRSAIEQRRDHGVDGLERKKITSSSDVQENKVKEMRSPVTELGGLRDQKLEIAIEKRKRRFRKASIKKTKKTRSKLSQALETKEKAEKLLEELEKGEIKQPLGVDKEGITEEQRCMLRKVGMKMRPFLRLGKLGVFDGTVENMHLHWKYRELVMQSLKLHVLKLGKKIEDLKVKLAQKKEANIQGDKGQNIQLEQEMTTPEAENMEPDSDLEVHKSNSSHLDYGQERELHGDALVFSNEIDTLQDPVTRCEDRLRESSMEFKEKDCVDFSDSKVDMNPQRDRDECEFTETKTKASIVSMKETCESETAKMHKASTSPIEFKVIK